MSSFVEGKDAAVGKKDFAGMPSEKVMKAYPKYNPGSDREIDDTIVGIDSANGQAAKQRRKYISDQK